MNLVRSHAAGVGAAARGRRSARDDAAARERAGQGTLGRAPEIVELLLAMLNARSVSADSGAGKRRRERRPRAARAPRARADRRRRAASREREHGDAASRCASVGLAPVTLGPKEGLALINGTQAHTALAALALPMRRRLWHTAHVAGAMSLEALMGTPAAFDARIHDARGQAGQQRRPRCCARCSADSEIRESHRDGDPRVQDAYALRCMPQVHGPVLRRARLRRVAHRRVSSTPRPTIRSCSRMATLLSGGNFHGQAVAHGARFPGDRPDEPRDDVRAAHRSARAIPI